jgi:hypothetical protein
MDGREFAQVLRIGLPGVPAAVLRPTTKSVDASVLLARALTPESVRPGWPEALRMSRSALPYERLLAIDERLEHAAGQPVIVPDTIVIDHAGSASTAPASPKNAAAALAPLLADTQVAQLDDRIARLSIAE